MARARRTGKVLVDWSQNDFGKSTSDLLADDALRRADAGDLFAPVLTLQQTLPDRLMGH